jgi:hypothetical protein
MSKKVVEGMSHEYVVFENGAEICRVSTDFYPHKPGVALSITHLDSVGLEALAADLHVIAHIITKYARGEATPDWEADFDLHGGEGEDYIPF